MEIAIPRRENIHRTDVADPVNWYYIWGTKTFFLHRLKMALAFTLKHFDEQGAKEEPVAVIDVSTDTGRTILAKKELRKQDFEKMNTYQTFRLSFFLKTSQKLEFRVFTHGQANLWADTITASFISGEWYDSPITVQEN